MAGEVGPTSSLSLPQLKASLVSRSGSAPQSGQRGNKDKPQSDAGGGKEGFAQKLVHRIKSIEERLEIVEKQKLDAQHFDRQKAMVERREQGLTEEVKQLREDMGTVRESVNSTHGAMLAKADGMSFDRLRNTHEELRSDMRGKADSDTVTKLQETVAALEKSIAQLDTQLQSKVDVAPVVDLQTRVTNVLHTLRSKADEDRLQHLHGQSLKTQAALEQLEFSLREKADVSWVQSGHRELQDLTSSVRDKGDAALQRAQQARLADVETQMAQLSEKIGQCTPMPVFSSLQETVHKCSTALKLKAEALDLQQMHSQLQGVQGALDVKANQIDSMDRWQSEANQQLTKLRQDVVNLSAEVQEQTTAFKALNEDF